jgi:hypothetical protein
MTKAIGVFSAVQVFGALPGAISGDPLGLHSVDEQPSSRGRGTVENIGCVTDMVKAGSAGMQRRYLRDAGRWGGPCIRPLSRKRPTTARIAMRIEFFTPAPAPAA